MRYLSKLFANKSNNILNVYVTAGYPNLNDTKTIMCTLQDSGVDIIELGMPYSDPLADGNTIQESSAVALQNGMSISVLLQQMQNIRTDIHIPIVLMGYLNPLLQFGFDKFCESISKIGIDALIIPDMPIFEYEKTYKKTLDYYQIDLIFLITPQTSNQRVYKIDAISSGFLYAVTSSSTTGANQNFSEVKAYLQRIKQMKLQNPILAGFGIKDKTTFNEIAPYCNGAIIGTAFIKELANKKTDELKKAIKNFIACIIE
jgi:tryptophan synthase alpha chain